MKTALIQSPLFWENSQANSEYFLKKIGDLQENVDLVVLPEMFTSGFTMQPAAVAEKMDGDLIATFKSLAKAKSVAITGSLVVAENGHFYNRLLFIYPSGEIKTYDKRHLFSLSGEEKMYGAGSEKLIVEYRDWKICLLVCYDLRFPVFSRNVEDYDLLVYVANWPKVRIYAWDILLKARAIENLSYVIGVNRIGSDKDDNEYNGHSQVCDFLGAYTLEPQDQEGTFIVSLDKNKMHDTRKKLGFLNDRDNFMVLD